MNIIRGLLVPPGRENPTIDPLRKLLSAVKQDIEKLARQIKDRAKR